MQFILSFLFISLLTTSIAIVPIRTFTSSRRRDARRVQMNERHEYRLNFILQKNTISILDVDYAEFSPPYLTEFCQEINAILNEDHESMEQILAKTAERFQETAYKEYNFPYTYREGAEVIVTSKEFFKYKDTYCRVITEREKVIGLLYVILLAILIIALLR